MKGNNAMTHAARHRPGFTLVELLVTVAIIAILLALLLPAIQSARESARRVHCGNNLKQTALASLSYENTNGIFPPTYSNTTPPVFPQAQSFSWLYWILPHLEGKTVFDSVLDVIRRTPIPMYFCPSRRPPGLYQGGTAKTDYVGCRGTFNAKNFSPLGNRYKLHDGVLVNRNCIGPPPPTGFTCIDCSLARNDVVVTAAMIRDGLSNTVMIGEARKAGPSPMSYGSDDNEDYANGGSGDYETGRHMGTGMIPDTDSRGASSQVITFGAAHPVVFGVALADGSVRFLSYTASPTILGYLAGRNDGQTFNWDDL